MSKLKISIPKNHLIEKTAAEFAAVWYDIVRTNNQVDAAFIKKWPNQRKFAQKNLEKFIAPALKHLTEMLGRPDLPDIMKKEIYDAIIERNNDPALKVFMPTEAPKLRPN